MKNLFYQTINPLLLQALGFSPANKEHMDNCLVYAFQKNMPPNFSLIFNHAVANGGITYAHRHGKQL